MILIVTTGDSEVHQLDPSMSAKTESHIDHDLELQAPSPHISSNCLDDHAVRGTSNGSTFIFESQVKVTSWLHQYNNDSASSNQYIHAEDDSTLDIKYTAHEMVPAATVDTLSAVVLEDESEKRLSSADSTEQTRQTTDSSNEGQTSEYTATSVTPWGTPTVGSIRSAQSTHPSRPTSPSGISDFSLFPSRYTPSVVSSILEHNSQRINPKKARLKNGINWFDSATTLARKQAQLGKPSSVALGKRPVGYYGIGDYRGGFPPDVVQLASYPHRPSTPSENSSVPARTDSKIQASSAMARRISRSKLNASLPPHTETYNLLTSSDIRSNPSSATSSQSKPTSVVVPNEENTVPMRRKLASVGNDLLECAEPIPVPKNGTHFKTGKRESVPAAFYAVAPSILGQHATATPITAMATTSDSADHYVPLSDACPLLVGPPALRQKLSAQGIDPEDPKVHGTLKQHDIAIERVTKADQILLWHLAIHNESRSLAKTKPDDSFSSAIQWKGAGQTYSDVKLTLRIFLIWLKEKEQAHTKLCQREMKRLTRRSAPNAVRWVSQRDKYDNQAIALSGALPLPHEPAAVWLNLYRLLRCRGISEEQLDREQVMTLMSKPRHERRECLNTLASHCKARTIDNADLDRRPKRYRSLRTLPTVRIRSPSYSFEAEDQILDLPEVNKYLRRGRSGRRSYSVTHPSFEDSHWDTPLGKLSLSNKGRLPKPLLSDIERPRNYVPPDRRKEGEDELPPSRFVGDGASKDQVCALARRGSVMSRFSRSTTASGKEGRTRWGRFRRGARRCLPPCCCG